MVLRQRSYDIDDLWQLVHQEDNADKQFELLDGELFEMSPPGLQHGSLAVTLSYHLYSYVNERDLGIVTVETGYHPPGNRSTLLAPDVAFTRKVRLPQPVPKRWVPLMPDLAVEIVSPSNSLKQIRRKAALYLDYGTQLVWIILPERKGVEVCRLDHEAGMNCAFIGQESTLSGEQVLPGFTLEISRLFA